MPEFVEGSSRPSKRKRVDPYEIDSDEEQLYSFSEQAKAYARGEPLPPIPSLVDETDGMVNVPETPMWVDDDGATLNSDDEDRISLGSFDVDEEIADAALWQVSSSTLDQCAFTDAAFSDSICIMPMLVPRNNLYSDNSNIFCAHSKKWSECDLCKGKEVQKQPHHPPASELWMLDSGASMHITGNESDLKNIRRLPISLHVSIANGQIVYINECGDADLRYKAADGSIQTFLLHDVYFLPQANFRLISLGQLMIDEDMTVSGHSRSITVRNDKSTLVFTPMFQGSTVYCIKQESEIPKQMARPVMSDNISSDIAHRRYAHPGDEVLRRFKNHTKGTPDFEVTPRKSPCPGCAQGKTPMRPFPASDRRASRPFELVHSDLKELPVESYYRQKYAMVFLDDATSHAWIVLLRQKSQAINALRQFLAMVATQYDTKVKSWMSDAGGEYKSGAFTNLLKENGIEILQSTPHMHQQNGRAERFIRTMMDKAEAMRFTACIPPSWWNFSLEHAVYVYNRTPLRRTQWRTPYEVMNGEVPDISKLRVFGCGAYVFIPEKVRQNKLSPKSELMTYLGQTTHGWKFMRAPNNVVFESTQAEFDEEFFPKCKDSKPRKERPNGQPPSDDHDHSNDRRPPMPDVDEDEFPQRRRDDTPLPKRPDQPADEQPARIPSPNPRPPAGERDEPEVPQPRRSTRQRNQPARPGDAYGESRPTERQRADLRRKIGDDQPSTSRPRRQPPRKQNDVPDHQPAPSTSQRDPPEITQPDDGDESELTELDDSDNGEVPPNEAKLAALCREGGVEFQKYLLSKAIEPDDQESNPREWTYRDILRLPKKQQKEWRKAALEELEALKKRKVYDLVDRPKGRKVIKNRWVFDVKSDGRKKARLVARGFSQVEGIDFDQIFSPVVRFETVRFMLALSALENWYLTGLDVRNAYLYGDLEEEIYMEQPEGFVERGQENKVLRLRKALYGLKQAGLVWWRTLDKSMKELGFTRLRSDAGVFVKHDGKDIIVVVVYVDDAIFMGSSVPKVLRDKELFMKKWECRDLGEAKEFLRMRIAKHGTKLCIDQCPYLDKVLKRVNMLDAKPAKTPLPDGYQPVKHEGAVDPALRTRFQTVIGSLLYIMLGTCPDIAFAVTKLAQQSANPSQDHLDKALYICRYLKGTRDYRLEYECNSDLGLYAYTDADWGSDPNTCRSQTGYLTMIAGGVFTWQSRAQRTAAHSSTDAEYMALSDCSRQVIWIRSLISELGYNLSAVPIYCDNQGAIFISSNPVTEKRSKHIDIRYHYIRDVQEQGLVKVEYVRTDENIADIFTKNLGRVKFEKFRQMLGLHIEY